MTHARAGFQAQLRDAVRAARGVNTPPPALRLVTRPAPALQPVARRTVLRLWLPLSALWVVLSPFALLLAPLLLLAPQLRGVRPYHAVWAIGRMLLSLSGTEVDVHAPDARIHVTIY